MKFSIDYTVNKAGWAEVSFTDGGSKVESAVSYMHDSLRELALMALSIGAGHKEHKVIFMDEPGELHFLVNLVGDEARYELRWYKDWASWGMGSEAEFELEAKGVCSSSRIIHQIKNILWVIYENHGAVEYKKLWINHDFPIELYERLMNK